MQLEPRIAVHPSGKQLQFYPEPHDYMLDGEKIPSVTSLIKQWFPQFDAQAVALKKADRDGVSYEALLAEWKRKRDEAATFGSKTHLMADTIFQAGHPDAADHLAETAREKSYLLAVKEALQKITTFYEIIDSEKIVFSPERRVAGTVDMLLRNRETGEYVVADWKTNREIKFQSYGEEKGTGLCAHLENCSFVHYSLQISAYSELLVSDGYIPAEANIRGVLLHLSETPDRRVVCGYIKTKDLKAEAAAILARS